MSTNSIVEIPIERLSLEPAVAEGKLLYGSPSALFWRSIQSVKLEAPQHDEQGARAYAETVTFGVVTTYWQVLCSRYAKAGDVAILCQTELSAN